MCIQSITYVTAPPPPPPPIPPPMYYYEFFYFYSIPVPAVVPYAIPPLFFPCSPPPCIVHNPTYPFHCPLILPSPIANDKSTTPKKTCSHDSSEKLLQVKKKQCSITAPKRCRKVQKVCPRKMRALVTSSSAAPTLVWRPKIKKIEIKDNTSVMVKNIPSRMSQKMLLEVLDKHCAKENQKNQNKDEYDLAPSEYDFVYLPMDFRSEFNLGYAFVNFTNAVAVKRFYHSFQNKKWEGFESKKICDVTLARIQGKEELAKNFARSYFACHSDEYLPAVFTPPRDGVNSTPPAPLGRRWSKK